MVDLISMSSVIGFKLKSAPSWLQSIQETFLNQGKDLVLSKGKEKIQGFLDERKHLRHIELALQNAVEQGAKSFTTPHEQIQ